VALLTGGELIFDGAYYPFSSVFFYANTGGLLLNGRMSDAKTTLPSCPKISPTDVKACSSWS
jgi:hypothetical protein